jgi:hypothetical protein
MEAMTMNRTGAAILAISTDARQLVEHDGCDAAWQPILEALP